VVPYKNHMNWARTRVLMYLARGLPSSRINHSFTVVFYRSDRFLRVLYGLLYGFYGQYMGLQTEISLQTQNTVVSIVCFSLQACTPTYPLP